MGSATIIFIGCRLTFSSLRRSLSKPRRVDGRVSRRVYNHDKRKPHGVGGKIGIKITRKPVQAGKQKIAKYIDDYVVKGKAFM
jgi:hypothetical protein